MYTKSIADLSALCVHYGITLQMYFLFNESLITRARNYCCDEFMRSDFQHLMFIDADIGFNPHDVIALMAMQASDPKYDIICGPYPKKCIHNSSVLDTVDGPMSIGKIVDTKYSGEVKSLDKNGNIVWRKVISHWGEPNLNKTWVSMQTSKLRNRSPIKVTSDHEVAYVDNPLSPRIEYSQASGMKGRWLVREPRLGKNSNLRPLLNGMQTSMLIGGALGDGCVKTGRYVANHGPKQLEYNKYKSVSMGGSFKVKEDLSSSHGFTNAQTQLLETLIYDKDGNKTISNVVNLIDPLALAVMYMDDGSRRAGIPSEITEPNDNTWWTDGDTTVRQKTVPGSSYVRGRTLVKDQATCSLATHSFSYSDNVLLQEHLMNRFGISSNIQRQGHHYHLWFNAENTGKLHDLIAEHVHPSMKYKINTEYHDRVFTPVDNEPLDYAASMVYSVDPAYGKGSRFFDIEVEDTNCFFANGVLVHNCISWEKIKMAVDKGHADENPENLNNFVGDYVFNPKAGVTEIPIGEPAEVSEGGTGFMMIARETLDRYKEAYPEQMYKPDHVRTEHFDGTREIMAYFDCIIDPESRRYLSEDYNFCYHAQKAGMSVWLCPWMQLQHVGTFVFGGSLAALASIGASATADSSQLKRNQPVAAAQDAGKAGGAKSSKSRRK